MWTRVGYDGVMMWTKRMVWMGWMTMVDRHNVHDVDTGNSVI